MSKTVINTAQAFEIILSYWEKYRGENKFFLYNPHAEKFILGIKSCHNSCNAPYTLYPMTFFADDNARCAKKFAFYCIIEKGEIVYNSFKDSLGDGVGTFSRSTFTKKQHQIVRHNDSYDDWKTLFQAIKQHMAKGAFEKVVAARKIRFTCDTCFYLPSILLNLFEKNINSYIFAYENAGETFFGASPELLIEKNARHMKSYALAGTIKKEGDVLAQGQQFLQDAKNVYEHTLVRQAIVQTMQNLGKNINIGPCHILELKNVLHMKTDIYAEEHESSACGLHKSNEPSIVQWVNALHPTPALGGSPKQSALEFIREHESFERGHYGAPFGVVDNKGDGIFIVGLRSASIKGKELSAFAGCGIVAQSHCREEYEEIDTKLQTIIEAL